MSSKPVPNPLGTIRKIRTKLFFSSFVILGTELGTVHMIGKCFTTELCPSPGFLIFLGREDKEERKAFASSSLRRHIANTHDFLPFSFFCNSGTPWPQQYYSMDMITERHGIQTCFILLWLRDGPGKLLLILSLENISFCCCQAVSQVGVFCYSVQLSMKEQMDKIFAWTTALLRNNSVS